MAHKTRRRMLKTKQAALIKEMEDCLASEPKRAGAIYREFIFVRGLRIKTADYLFSKYKASYQQALWS